jgi:hypothetical protein
MGERSATHRLWLTLVLKQEAGWAARSPSITLDGQTFEFKS